MKSIAVFCGSSTGSDPAYEQEAFRLGQVLASRHIRVVYGGARIGLMGAVANGALAAGGAVVGVIPEFLKTKEIAHDQLTELIIVESMHERKITMNERCDGVIALPGGFGTMEEFFEMLTWSQLGLHQKPLGILNTRGYYDDLISLVGKMVKEAFLREENSHLFLVDSKIESLLERMEKHVSPIRAKWISQGEV